MNLSPLSSVFAVTLCGDSLVDGSVQLLLGRISNAWGVTDIKDHHTMTLETYFRKESQHLTQGTAMGHVKKIPVLNSVTFISKDSSSWLHKRTTLLELDIDPTIPAPRRLLTDLLAESSECLAAS